MALTAQTIDSMTKHDDWAGFGYLGERQRNIERTHLVSRADTMLLDHVDLCGVTEEELFEWANSKEGRWYGDCWFGANGQHAERFLP